MPVDEPVELEVLVVVAEGIDQLFGHLEQAHVEEELEDGEDGNVEVDVHGHATGPHEGALLHAVNLLPADHGEDEENVGGQGDDLGVHHGDGHPVVAPQQPALGSKFAKFLKRENVCLSEMLGFMVTLMMVSRA